MAKPNYPELVAEAERSVQGVKDPELRRIAFQKVLEELLGGEGSSVARAGRPMRKRNNTKAEITRKSSPSGPLSYLRGLVDDDFFKKQRSIADVKAELENQGHHIPVTSLSGPLQTVCQQKSLRRQKKEGLWVYSNY